MVITVDIPVIVIVARHANKCSLRKKCLLCIFCVCHANYSIKHTLYNYLHMCMQDIREWLQEVISQLSNTNLNLSAKLAAAVVLMCCARRVCTSIPDDMCLTLLKMMALQPDGAGVIAFLQSLMKNENISRYVVLHTYM